MFHLRLVGILGHCRLEWPCGSGLHRAQWQAWAWSSAAWSSDQCDVIHLGRVPHILETRSILPAFISWLGSAARETTEFDTSDGTDEIRFQGLLVLYDAVAKGKIEAERGENAPLSQQFRDPQKISIRQSMVTFHPLPLSANAVKFFAALHAEYMIRNSAPFFLTFVANEFVSLPLLRHEMDTWTVLTQMRSTVIPISRQPDCRHEVQQGWPAQQCFSTTFNPYNRRNTMT